MISKINGILGYKILINIVIYKVKIKSINISQLRLLLKIIGESNRIRTVPEYGHSRYLRNHKSYKKMFNE